MPHNLITAQENPVPLPKFLMAPRFKILMFSGSMKGTQTYHAFHSKNPGKRIPSRFPNRASMERDTPLQDIFRFVLIYLFIFPSESPVREPPPCSMTGSPWTGILRHHHSFIHTSMYVSRSPQKKPSYIWKKKNISSPCREPHADGRPTYNEVRSG